ncbi:MAG: L-aspartate oxidase [Tissierellia bacterium]|nr:L-aspartate oxidase [Tissierellia bacterium]
MERIQFHHDVIIVGTGAAGLFCALNLPEDAKVLMITKDKLENSDSYLAQGGICCMLGPEDFDSYFEDTMRAGHYENDPAAVENMLLGSQHVIHGLLDLGVDFDRDADGKLSFTREGGHSRYRILHHQDITGKEIVTKLIERVQERKNIVTREYVEMVDLLTEEGRCYGIVARDEEGQEELLSAGAVVLATGGLGGLFDHSTNFPHITGDGLAIALRHGVELRNIAYIQIHPTSLYSREPGRKFLISEAVRGEGAKLINHQGQRFTDELKPRDVVAAAIKAEMERQGTDHVFLSFADIPREVILSHFPNIYERCLEEGYDITREPVPVTPAQHYLMGGIGTDTQGKTSMERLYAIGETACNGVHGANRLASNSLLESLVFAERAALAIAQELKERVRAPGPSVTPQPSLVWDPESLEGSNRELVLSEIRKQGKDFYEQWRNI